MDPTPVLTDDEIAALRAITPGCGPGGVVHLDHAGSSLPTERTLDTQIRHLRDEAVRGGYHAANAASDRRAAVYESIATLIGAQPDEIARTEHSTAAWNAAFWSVPMEPGQRILVHDQEYGANIVAFLHAAETRGVRLDRVRTDESGQVDVGDLERRLRGGDVALVSLTHVPTNGGLVNPAADVGRLASGAGVPYLLDACQSVGQRRIDVDEIGCDFLAATGRKYLRGPRGTGFLYVRASMLDRVAPSQPDHHGAELVAADRFEWAAGARRFEYWEHNVAAWLGLGAAVDQAIDIGAERIEATVERRADELRSMLDDAGLRVHDDGAVRCGIVTTSKNGVDAGALHERLAAQRVNATTTHIGSTRWDAERRALPVMLRLSVHYTTTEDELSTAVEILRDAS